MGRISGKISTPKFSRSKFNIVLMVTGTLIGRMGVESILPVTISAVLNFDGPNFGVGTCEQGFKTPPLS